MRKKIKVLVVDDSAVVRQVLSGLLERDPGIAVLAAVADPLFAIERMKRQWPDVILLDIEMPRMNGIAFLKKIMKERPTPVVICSSQTENGAATTLQALSAGAVDIITKPRANAENFLVQAAGDLIRITDFAMDGSLTLRIHDVEMSPSGINVGIEASAGATSTPAPASGTQT